MNHVLSVFLYLFIVIITYLLAKRSQRVHCSDVLYNTSTNCPFDIKVLLLAFAILWFFLFFSNNGPDYGSYYTMIGRTTWANFSNRVDEEPLFNALCIVVKTILGGNIDFSIGIIKTISLIIAFFAIYNVRSITNVGFSVLSFVLLSYQRSFYLLPMMLSASIVLLAFSIYRKSNKKILPMLLMILAAQIHNTAYIIVVIFALILLQNSIFSKVKASGLKKVLLFGLYLLIILFADAIFKYSSVHFTWFHYSGYEGGATANSGLFWLIIYVPLFVISEIVSRSSSIEDKEKDTLLILILSSGLCRWLAYSYGAIERMELFFLAIFVIYISEYLHQDANLKSIRKYTIATPVAIIYIYILFRGYLRIESDMASVFMSVYSFYIPF